VVDPCSFLRFLWVVEKLCMCICVLFCEYEIHFLDKIFVFNCWPDIKARQTSCCDIRYKRSQLVRATSSFASQELVVRTDVLYPYHTVGPSCDSMLCLRRIFFSLMHIVWCMYSNLIDPWTTASFWSANVVVNSLSRYLNEFRKYIWQKFCILWSI